MNTFIKLLKQGITFPYKFIFGRMQKSSQDLDSLPVGEGAVLDENGEKIAVYKKNDTETVRLSAKCTHMGCIIGWNGKEKTWDCPCHNSKFSAEGKVIRGPATKDLQKEN